MGQTIHIAYTANLNCTLESCKCGDDLGGIPRLAYLLDSLRREHPDLILLDSGDFLSSYILTESNRLMAELVSDLNYDVIAVGDQEYVEGMPFLQHITTRYHLPLISATIRDKERDSLMFPAYKIVHRRDITVGIIGVVFKEAFDFISPKEIRIEPVGEVLSKLVSQVKSRSTILILLLHSSYRIGLELAKRFPEIAVIIAGHSQEKASIQNGNQIVVQPGSDGEYLGFLEISFKNGKFDFKNSTLPVGAGLGENPLCRSKIDAFYRKLK
ncbi:MAG: hypothetical protein Kow0042_17170 [Calditrichia bacterium]